MLKPTEVPDRKLQSLWKYLDMAELGYIEVGVYGRFMRLGEPPMPAQARVRVRALNAEASAQVRCDMSRRTGKGIAKELKASAEPAGDEELQEVREAVHRIAWNHAAVYAVRADL